MKIEITRGGGLLGSATRTELDDALLTPEATRQLAALVEGTEPLSDATEELPPQPDALAYELTLEDESGRRTARFTDATMSEEARALIGWVDSQPQRVTSILGR